MSGPLPDEVVARFLARYRAERAEAGLPEKVTDPDVLARVASIVTATNRIANRVAND